LDEFFDANIDIDPNIDEFSLANAVSIDSKIVTKPDHKKLLKKWMKEAGFTKYKLIYRGTRDGFTA